jgi:hypothetical protein
MGSTCLFLGCTYTSVTPERSQGQNVIVDILSGKMLLGSFLGGGFVQASKDMISLLFKHINKRRVG